MGKIVITTNTSLDGVVQDPDGEEGFRRGGWFYQFGGKDLEEWTKVETEEALRAEALLLGRRSDEWFATRWASRTGEWLLSHVTLIVVCLVLVLPDVGGSILEGRALADHRLPRWSEFIQSHLESLAERRDE